MKFKSHSVPIGNTRIQRMDVDNVLLFVGRTGNGKSSTANSVIGEKFFNTGKLCDEKSVLQTKTVEVDGFKMTVVDGTGIGDTGSDMNGDIQDIIQKAETAVQLCESGFNALIFVMTYGTRFTRQEKDSVDLIKSLFGRDIFRRFGIIVMTRGDQFEMDMEIDDITFDQWCKEQTGDVRSLFQECEHRKVLFNNRSTNNATFHRQRNDLLSLVSNFNTYSIKDFKLASKDRQNLLLKQSFSNTERANQLFLYDIDQKIKQAHLFKDDKRRRDMLQKMRTELDTQIQKIRPVFEGSEYSSLLMTPLQTRLLNVETMMRQPRDSHISSHPTSHAPSQPPSHSPSHTQTYPPRYAQGYPPSHTQSYRQCHMQRYPPVINQQPRRLPQLKPPKTHANNASDRKGSCCCN